MKSEIDNCWSNDKDEVRERVSGVDEMNWWRITGGVNSMAGYMAA